MQNIMQKQRPMKKILILALLFSSLQAFPQGLRFSVFFDPAISWMNPDVKNINRDGVRPGFGFGMMMDAFFARYYAFSTGLSIKNTGGVLFFEDPTTLSVHGSVDTVPGGSDITYKLQYISVPVGLKFKSNEIGYTTFWANLGLLPEMRVRATADVTEINFQNENIIEETGLFNTSYFIGGGIEYSLGGNTALISGVYYTNGFLDIAQKEEFGITTGSVTLRLGILF